MIATPAFVTAELVADLDPELAAAHAEIPYASSVVVTLGFSRARRRPARRLRLRRPACGWKRRAGVHLVVAEVGGACAGRRRPAAGLRGSVRRTRRHGGRGRRADRARSRRARVPRRIGASRCWRASTAGREECRSTCWAIPSCSRGSTTRSPTHPGLAVAGAAYRGVGIPDCIQSGELAAQTVAQAIVGAYAHEPRALRGALRRGARPAPRRRQLAGARVQGRRRLAALHRPRRGRVPRRRRREPVHRLRALVGAARPRPCASPRRRGSRGRAPQGHQLRRAEPARARARPTRARRPCRASSSCASSAPAPRRR